MFPYIIKKDGRFEMNRENVKRIIKLVTQVDTEIDCYEGAIAPPLFETSIYRAGNFTKLLAGEQQYLYSKNGNPTNALAEHLLAQMEKGEQCRLYSSGTGAIFTALLCGARAGSHMIIVRSCYGRSSNFARLEFQRLGLSHTEVDGKDLDEIENAIRPETTLLYLESPTSWNAELQDLPAIAALAKKHGILTVIDNTYASPVFQNPIDFGIDIVVQSASKYLSGHSDMIGGVLVTSNEIAARLTDIGANMAPYIASRLMRSLRTLPLRMVRHEANALKVASWLEQQPKIKSVSCPGLPSYPQKELFERMFHGSSGLFSVILDTDHAGAVRFMDHVPAFNITASWGGYETIINCSETSPDIESGSPYELRPRQVRISVGLEDPEDVISQLDYALSKI